MGEEAAAVAEAVPAAEDRQPNATATPVESTAPSHSMTTPAGSTTGTVTVNDFDGCMRYESDDDYQAQECNTQEGTYVVRRTEEYSYHDSDKDSADLHANPPCTHRYATTRA